MRIFFRTGNLFLTLVFLMSSVVTVQSQITDEPLLRDLTTKFFRSLEKLDVEAHLSIWSKTSEEGAFNWSRIPKAWEVYEKTELKKLEIHSVSVDGDMATVRLAVHFAAWNKKTGKPMGSFMNHDSSLSFRYVKTEGNWLLDSWITTAMELSESFMKLKSDEERESFLAAEKARIDSEFVNALGILAMNLASNDANYTDAQLFGKIALRLAEGLGDKKIISQNCARLGNTYMGLGDHGLALIMDLRHLKLERELGEEGNPRNALNSVGVDYAILGDFRRAIEYYEESLRTSKPRPPSPEAITRVLGNIVNSAIEMGDLTKARDTLPKLFEIAQKNDIKAELVRSYSFFGDLKKEERDYASAREYYLQAVEMQKGEKDPARDNFVLKNLAAAELLVGNYSEALATAQKARDIANKIGIPDLGWDAEVTAARAYIALGKPELARASLNSAIQTVEAMRKRALGSEDQQQVFFDTKMSPYLDLVSVQIATGETEQALTSAEMAKARTILSYISGNRMQITKSMTDSEKAQERTLALRVTRLNSQFQSMKQNPRTDAAQSAKVESELANARSEHETFRSRLFTTHPELLALRGEMREITAPETSPLFAGPKTALVEFVVTENKTYLLCITLGAQQKPSIVAFPIDVARERLSELIGTYRSKLAAGELDFQKQSRELYDLLLKPAAKELAGKTNIVIVPDGPLWDLPFQALQEESGKYLTERAAVSYAPSLTALKEMRKKGSTRKPSPETQLLAFGNPIVAKETTERLERVYMAEKLKPLPEAERLVTQLGIMYGTRASKLFTGADAREETAKREAPKYRIVQFATHGILNNTSPMYSHLVLAQDEKNPNEDGLLEAWELKDLDLNADMVILSACDTARGKVSGGEGVIGMTWAAFIAGAPTTVASLWKVESSSTTDFMLEFHRQMLGNKNISKAEALRRASLKLMRSAKYRHPSYWAPWVLVGDGSGNAASGEKK